MSLLRMAVALAEQRAAAGERLTCFVDRVSRERFAT